MADLIDREAAISITDYAVDEHPYKDPGKPETYCAYNEGWNDACDYIRVRLESVKAAEAVEIVRCRDCKHFRHYGKTSLFINGKNIKAGWCQRRIRYDEEYRMTADDFCSYGERKDGDSNG